MSEVDDKGLAPDPSSEVDLDAAPAPQDGDQDAIGASSSDAQGDTESSALSIARDVVGKREQEAASPADGSEEGSDPDKGDAEKNEQPDDENYSDVPFHKHPRFQHLLRKAKTNEADALRYRNVQTFLDNNGLSGEEVAEGLVVMALAKTKPHEAWERLKPFVQSVLQAAGEVLPEELGRRVEAGELSREAAQELSRAQARANSVEAARTFEQKQAEARQQQERQTAIHDAAVSWEQARMEKDPNFAAKQPSLLKEVAWLQKTEGVPDSPQGVRDQLERAYKAVVLPVAARPTAPAPTVGEGVRKAPLSAAGGTSGNAQPVPKTTMDIIQGVVGKRQAG